MYPVYSNLWKLLDLLFPPHCAGCNMEESRFCDECYSSVTFCAEPICDRCGDCLSINDGKTCNRCLSKSPLYTSNRSWAIYDGHLRKAIKSLKYRRNFRLGERLAEPMVELLDKQNWTIDIVTAVPLDIKRVRERGFNQSRCLAQPIAYFAQLPFSSGIITRIRRTRPQVGLNYEERKRNVKGAFQSESRLLDGKSILIVDDVITTGATINACAEALINAGAICVYGLSLARAARLLVE